MARSHPSSTTDTPTRTYLHVQPADEPLDAASLVTATRQLHTVPDGRLRAPDPPTIECCLATAGDGDVTYYLGTDGDIDRLERTVRSALPTDYDLDRTAWHPRETFGDESPATALDLHATADRPQDWQTRLTPYAALLEEQADTATDTAATPPLATVAAALADSDAPAIYRALLQPYPDWRDDRTAREHAIESYQDTLRDQLVNAVVGDPAPNDVALPPDDRSRLDALADRDARHSFVLTARVLGTDRVCRECADAFGACDGPHHGLRAVTTDAPGDVEASLQDRQPADPTYGGLANRLPGRTPTSRGIVVDAHEAPTFWCLDGARLPQTARRGVSPTASDHTHDPHPADATLARYDAGLPLGRPVTGDGTTAEEPVRLPPDLQPLHVAWFGQTGSGKSTALINGILDNHAATEGLDLLVDPKGDGFATDYLRAHRVRFGDLDDVIYFDCSEVVPAIPFFDIRGELDAGVPRPTAVEDTVDHYMEILRGVMGDERFDQAVRAPDVIRYLVKAQFDPVHGDDAFAHRDLHAAARRMHERQSAPAVSDEDLERMLNGLVANRARTFDEIMQGVANRIEKLPADRRLARVFDHVPDDPVGDVPVGDDRGESGDTRDEDQPADPPEPRGPDDPRESDEPDESGGDPHFDLGALLDEDVVVVLDTGGLRAEARRVLTLVVLSNLWTALRRRARRRAGEAGADGTGTDTATEAPLVNLYLEEAATVAETALLQDLLAQGRGFGLSVTLAMQFPGQIRERAPEAHAELLNDVGTVCAGPVPMDEGLARRFATADTPPDEVAPRLRALDRGEWLTTVPAGFGERAPSPFVVRSCPEPPVPQTPATDRAIDRCRDRTRRLAGLTLADPSTVETETATSAGTTADEPAESTAAADTAAVPPLDTALPHTRRLPDHIEYDPDATAVRCARCDARYDPTTAGVRRAIGCCGSLDEVDRDDVPIARLNVKLTPAEIRDSDWSPTQLAFLQAVYNAQQRRYDPLEYDLLRDSMLRLQEYVGIDDAAVDELVAAGLVRHDGDHPHRLFSVTPDGRDAIGESYRSGTDYGHGEGDLDESSQHVVGVVAGERWLDQAYVANDDSPVVEVVPYYDLDDGENRRLDIAGVDADGEVRVAVEVERINNDAYEAVPADYDKLASCDPDAAVWITMSGDGAHDVLEALADPPDGAPRVEKTYSETTPPQQFRIDQPGLTDVVPLGRVLRELEME